MPAPRGSDDLCESGKLPDQPVIFGGGPPQQAAIDHRRPGRTVDLVRDCLGRPALPLRSHRVRVVDPVCGSISLKAEYLVFADSCQLDHPLADQSRLRSSSRNRLVSPAQRPAEVATDGQILSKWLASDELQHGA